MEEQLKEIEGTLARTKERKSTLLYKHSRKQSEEERLAKLGVRSIPTIPSKVDDVRVAKYALFQINRELGEKKALITNSSRLSIEKDGEAHVRAVNNEINKLLRQKSDWIHQINKILGKKIEEEPYKRKKFFGCAQDLPEAVESRQQKKGTREENARMDGYSPEEDLSDDEDSEEGNEQIGFENLETFSNTYLSMVSNMREDKMEEILLSAERAIESTSRADVKERPASRVRYDPDFIVDFLNSEKDFPSEDHFKQLLTQKRKNIVLAKLQQLKR